MTQGGCGREAWWVTRRKNRSGSGSGLVVLLRSKHVAGLTEATGGKDQVLLCMTYVLPIMGY